MAEEEYRKRFDSQERRINYLEEQLHKFNREGGKKGESEGRREVLYEHIIKQKNKEI